MPVQFSSGEDTGQEGETIFPLNAEDFPNWNQELERPFREGKHLRRVQSRSVSGKPSVRSQVWRQQEAGRPPLLLPRKNATRTGGQRGLRGAGEREAEPVLQVAVQAKKAAAAPAESVAGGFQGEGQQERVLSNVSTQLARVGRPRPAPPHPARATPASASSRPTRGRCVRRGRVGGKLAPAPLRGVATRSAPTCP